MNSTVDGLTSQMSADQRSETSSVCPQSPNPSSPQKHAPQSSARLGEQHQYHESFTYPGSAHTVGGFLYDLRTRPSTSQQTLTPVQTPSKRAVYTGVDKLLEAAMLDEAARSLATSGGWPCIPSGRGIGYFSSSLDTYSKIPTPSNKCELELYNLLDKANLLNYFGTFLSFGGDDVQQLMDADEEEFLEIMSLVGMTKKPLHVRRLQKALADYAERKERQREDTLPLGRRAGL